MTNGTARDRGDGRRGLVVALVLAAIASVFLLFTGLVTRTRYSTTGARTVEHVSLWESRGVSALLVLSIPVLIAVVALIATRMGAHAPVLWIAAALLWLWVVAFIAHIGGFYVPAAIAATFAAVMNARRRPSRSHHSHVANAQPHPARG